jgi:hypothetical protein
MLNEERENLRLLQQTLKQERVAHTHGGGARDRARDVNRRIVKDWAGEPPVFNRASQNIVAAAMLLCNMPKPSTPEARQARDEIRGLLEAATMQQAESLASRRRGFASEQPAEPSRQEKEAWFIPSPHHGGTKRPPSETASSTTVSPEMPVTTSTSVAGVEAMTVHLKATTCTGVDVMIAQKIVVHLSSRRTLESSARPFVGPSFRSDFAPPTTLTKYNGETKPELWLTDFRLACQLGGSIDDRVIIR